MGSDYLMARLYRDYWGKSFSIDDLQKDIIKISNQRYVLEVIRYIERNVERWSTEKGVLAKPGIISQHSEDPGKYEGPIVYFASEYWTDEALELAELADEIFMNEIKCIWI